MMKLFGAGGEKDGSLEEKQANGVAQPFRISVEGINVLATKIGSKKVACSCSCKGDHEAAYPVSPLSKRSLAADKAVLLGGCCEKRLSAEDKAAVCIMSRYSQKKNEEPNRESASLDKVLVEVFGDLKPAAQKYSRFF
ncbi:hypothetical protein SUGI_0362750 [Cryptomeria japonica]|nr:hypothetical protein SUGI_0362750 [Cryptomeria japonica]